MSTQTYAPDQPATSPQTSGPQNTGRQNTGRQATGRQATSPSWFRIWAVVIGTAVMAVLVVLGVALWHGQSSTTPATTGTSTSTSSPAQPSAPTANPAVPSHPAVNPAVPNRPAANPAVPATPSRRFATPLWRASATRAGAAARPRARPGRRSLARAS